MYCKRCGYNLGETQEKICPHCGEVISDIVSENKNVEKESQSFLIIGIILALCCSLPFGIAVVFINEYKYKPLLREKNYQEANKFKTLMILLSVIGFVLGIILGGLSFVLEFIAAFE